LTIDHETMILFCVLGKFEGINALRFNGVFRSDFKVVMIPDIISKFHFFKFQKFKKVIKNKKNI